MSNPFLQPPKISYNSFRNTIFTDQQVFRWFLYLVRDDAVRADVSGEEEVRAAYTALYKWRPLQQAVLALIMGIVLAVIVTQNYFWIWLLLPLWGAMVAVERPLKTALHRISRALVDKHYDPKTFPQHTLYQIGEFLARQYHKSSLVEGVALSDMWLRKWLVIVAFLVVFMFVMSFWRGAAMIVLLYFAGNIVINSRLIYERYLK